MAPDGGGGSRNGSTSGRNGGGSRQVLKKGPWTAAEDSILIEYVKRHGEGNWNAVQRNSGLNRCGKSCRLRWANHLRPNLKKGAFSAEEERLIVELHAKFGNKWARMASQLPGRTDNEIKNYWNTRVKRRQRAGLPIYPHEIKLQQQQHHHHQPNSSLLSLSSLLSSPSQTQKNCYNPSLSLLDTVNFSSTSIPPQNRLTSSYLSNSNPQLKLFRDNNGGLALSLATTNLPFPSSSSTPFFNQGEFLPTPSVQFNSLSFNNNQNTNTRVSFKPSGYAMGMGIGLPSIQSPVPAATTPTSSGSDYHVMGGTSSDGGDYGIGSRGNSGLLEDLLGESHALTCAEKAKKQKLEDEEDDGGKGKCVLENWLTEDAIVGHGSTTNPQNQWEDINSSHSLVGTKAKKNPMEEMNAMDDDLFGLLDNFPLTVPVPDWYEGSDNVSNMQSSNMTDGNFGMENQREASRSPAATTNHDRNNGSCCWNNMPGIY